MSATSWEQERQRILAVLDLSMAGIDYTEVARQDNQPDDPRVADAEARRIHGEDW